jgi:hypothetical protein
VAAREKIALIESLNPRWADLAERWGWEISLKVGVRPDGNKQSNSEGNGSPE